MANSVAKLRDFKDLLEQCQEYGRASKGQDKGKH
jgi:hypothetical protein